jgi:hypothetical protein
MRNKKVAPEPQPVPTQPPKSMEEEFPRLSTAQIPLKIVIPPIEKSFASMATEWAVHHDKNVQTRELEKSEAESFNIVNRHRRLAPLPHFHNIRHFVEPEDEEEYEEQQKPAEQPDEDSGWTEVIRTKHRKVKSFEERMNRPPTPDEKSEETVWNGNDEDDSYWRR